jgi:hypothetical protein
VTGVSGDDPTSWSGDDLPPDVRAALDPRLQMGRAARLFHAVMAALVITGVVLEAFLGRRRGTVFVQLLTILVLIKTWGIDGPLIALVDNAAK